MRFKHDEGIVIERRPLKAGGLRFNRGMVETHEVESLSDFSDVPECRDFLARPDSRVEQIARHQQMCGIAISFLLQWRIRR